MYPVQNSEGQLWNRFGQVDDNCAYGTCLLPRVSPQVPKQEKHGSGNDSDYDNTQSYDVSLRSDLPYKDEGVFMCSMLHVFHVFCLS